MIRKDILKKFLAIFISGVTFMNIIGLKNTKIKKPKKPMNIKYKTNKEIYNEINENWIKPAEEKKVEELAEKQRQEALNNSQDQNNLSRGGIIEEKTFVLTFYTNLNSENGFGSITCEGKKLRDGVVANNVLPLHTKIHLEEYGEVEVLDRGGDNFNTEERLDVFVARGQNESDYKYKKRVNSMGKVKTKGFIIK